MYLSDSLIVYCVLYSVLYNIVSCIYRTGLVMDILPDLARSPQIWAWPWLTDPREKWPTDRSAKTFGHRGQPTTQRGNLQQQQCCGETQDLVSTTSMSLRLNIMQVLPINIKIWRNKSMLRFLLVLLVLILLVLLVLLVRFWWCCWCCWCCWFWWRETAELVLSPHTHTGPVHSSPARLQWTNPTYLGLIIQNRVLVGVIESMDCSNLVIASTSREYSFQMYFWKYTS